MPFGSRIAESKTLELTQRQNAKFVKTTRRWTNRLTAAPSYFAPASTVYEFLATSNSAPISALGSTDSHERIFICASANGKT